ncbi:MAG: hypothetical protein FWH20_11150 [Oscillospiraceae bacterium]|nr:hypothetical protein [Oscillospiraceae bacterium]
MKEFLKLVILCFFFPFILGSCSFESQLKRNEKLQFGIDVAQDIIDAFIEKDEESIYSHLSTKKKNII